MQVSYAVSVDLEIEVMAIHGKEAKEKLIEYLKDHPEEINWTETHNEECECTKCRED